MIGGHSGDSEVWDENTKGNAGHHTELSRLRIFWGEIIENTVLLW